jgi:hypothetical protein
MRRQWVLPKRLYIFAKLHVTYQKIVIVIVTALRTLVVTFWNICGDLEKRDVGREVLRGGWREKCADLKVGARVECRTFHNNEHKM